MIEDTLVGFVFAFVKILVTIVLSLGAAYSGISFLDKLTRGIDEWKEIKKGNLAVGVLYSAVILSLALLVMPRIEDFVMYVAPNANVSTAFYSLAVTFVNYLLSLFLGVFFIYLTINLLDYVTTDLDEMDALKKGNVTVALIMAVVIISVMIVARFPFENIFVLLKSVEGIL
ncbi:DUF350 domain-containing protein [Candidatus Micrarchaeota archaeon]|nr:DUF350 domain-containing protein [Candidatus Micrarchaeota archaeon]